MENRRRQCCITSELRALFFTAKRLRPRAQGCFNPGKRRTRFINPERVAFSMTCVSPDWHHDYAIQLLDKNWIDARRNRVAVKVSSRCYPGLRQPWALGRNRFAVSAAKTITANWK